MILITLHGSRITLEPPQPLAMLEVKRLADGLMFKVLHDSGFDSDDEPESVELPVTREVLQWISEIQLKSSATDHQVNDKQFPVVGKLNLRQLPKQYRLIPDVLPRDFEFTPGEDFRIFVIGREWVEIVVTAT